MPMNALAPAPIAERRSTASSTLAAEGLPRRAFSVRDVERMAELGILGKDERVELIGGELVPMAAKGIRHEVVKRAILQSWAPLFERGIHWLAETTLRTSDDTFFEPDFVLFPASLRLENLNGAAVLLAVEIADSSLDYDLGRKPDLYAKEGVKELWVVDARRLTTTLFLEPGASGYRRAARAATGDRLVCAHAPEVSLCLGDFELY
jgi:Uma2 family endonuclease